jgi:hypothetical protein
MNCVKFRFSTSAGFKIQMGVFLFLKLHRFFYCVEGEGVGWDNFFLVPNVLPSSSHELSPSSQSVPQDVPNSSAILSHFFGPKVEYMCVCVCVCVCELKRGGFQREAPLCYYFGGMPKVWKNNKDGANQSGSFKKREKKLWVHTQLINRSKNRYLPS